MNHFWRINRNNLKDKDSLIIASEYKVDEKFVIISLNYFRRIKLNSNDLFLD